jgi:predicted porin
MNKTPFAATLLALAAGPALAQSTVTISGVADLAVRQVSNEDRGSVKSLVSGNNSTSRLVFRGNEDLGGGLAASFWLEHGIALDTGNPTGGFWDRRSTVSLTSKTMGELRLGRDFVPSYLGWNRYDPFSYVGAAGSNNGVSATPQGPIRAAFGTTANTTVRASNAVQYWLPGGLGGFEGNVLVAAAEGSTGADNKTMGARLGWAGGPVAVSVAHTITENGTTAATGKFKDTAIGGSYRLGSARINLAWRKFEQARAEQTNLMLSGAMTFGAHELKASVLRIDMAGRVGTTAIDANDAQQLGLGYVYSFSKRSAAYTTYSTISNDGAATFVVPGGPAGLAGGKSSSGFELGLRHNF